VDPILFDRSYFLQPHQVALSAYGLLRDAMTDTGHVGLGRVAIRTQRPEMPRDVVSRKRHQYIFEQETEANWP
jgi:non-homologous end joining protein Ku